MQYFKHFAPLCQTQKLIQWITKSVQAHCFCMCGKLPFEIKLLVVHRSKTVINTLNSTCSGTMVTLGFSVGYGKKFSIKQNSKIKTIIIWSCLQHILTFRGTSVLMQDGVKVKLSSASNTRSKNIWVMVACIDVDFVHKLDLIWRKAAVFSYMQRISL